MRPENYVPIGLVVAGVASVIVGVAFVYWPAALVLAGFGLSAAGILTYEDGRT